MTDKVQVELIENPEVKRTMTRESFLQNQRRWRLSAGQQEIVAPKKVAPVASVGEQQDDSEFQAGITVLHPDEQPEGAPAAEEPGDAEEKPKAKKGSKTKKG